MIFETGVAAQNDLRIGLRKFREAPFENRVLRARSLERRRISILVTFGHASDDR